MSFAEMLRDLTETAGIDDQSILGNFLYDVTSDDPSEGLGDVLGVAGAVGLAAVLGGALAATTGLGDVLSGRAETTDPETEARAKLILRALVQVAKADGLSFAQKQALLDRVDRGNPRDVLALNALFNAPVDARALAADTPPDMAEAVLATVDGAARGPEGRAYADALRRALGAA